EGELDVTHRANACIAVKLPQQLLLDRIAADTMLGERTSTHRDHRGAELEDGVLALRNVIGASGDHVGMNIAVGNVAPHREVEAAGSEELPADRHHLAETLVGHD